MEYRKHVKELIRHTSRLLVTHMSGGRCYCQKKLWRRRQGDGLEDRFVQSFFRKHCNPKVHPTGTFNFWNSAAAMPYSETPDQRQIRRSAVKTIGRLSTALGSPDVLSRDAGPAVLSACVAQLRDVLEGEELEILLAEVQKYEDVTGVTLSAHAPAAAVPPLPSRSQFRVHGADVQLTFNKASWIAEGEDIDNWFRQAGANLVSRFQTWALEDFPKKFRERILHTSLTLEESCQASGGQKRVHLHAQFTFATRIDRSGVADFVFDGVSPHIAPCHVVLFV